MKRNLLGLLHESKKPPPHMHVVGHTMKVFIARLGKRRGGGCIAILFIIGREGARGSFEILVVVGGVGGTGTKEPGLRH